MSGYLEEYGAGEDRKETLIRNSIVIAAILIVAGAFFFYLFQTFPQVRTTKHFINLVRARDYAGAYAAWGCKTPCVDYPYNKFMEDWGPQRAGASPHITDSETCGSGVIVTVAAEGGPRALFVEKGSDALSFSPVEFCAHRGAWTIMLHRTLGRLRWIFF